MTGGTMAELFTMLGLCFLTLLLAPSQVLARWNAESLFERALTHGGINVNLLSHDHVNSPFANPHQRRSERVAAAVQRSRQRHESINGARLSTSDIGSKAYISPRVYPFNGSYLMELTLGTPPRTFVAIADTGSDLVWVNCRGCSECVGQPDPLFDPAKSSTYSIVSCADPTCILAMSMDYYLDDFCSANGTGSCPYGTLYGDGSETTGTFSKETVSLLSTDGSALSVPGFYFGCGYNISGLLGGTDGLVGLGKGELSLVSQLGPSINHTFSYCLVDSDSGLSKASSLVLGSTNGRNLPLAYTPLLTNIYIPSFYYVSVTGISINGKKLDYPEGSLTLDEFGFGGTIVDSGTTLTYLSYDVYLPFLETMQKLINYPLAFSFLLGFDLCYNVSGIRKPTYPTVVFHLDGVNVTLANENVFTLVDDAGETACLAFYGSFSFFGPGISILGNLWQQNLYQVFDIAKNRLGIAPTKC